MTQTIIKSYSVRLYPTKEQEAKFWEHIGCCRYVWNYMINLQKEHYAKGLKHLSAFDMMKELTSLKRGVAPFLKTVSNTSLQIICQELEGSYKNFFNKKCRYPQYKSRRRSKVRYPHSTYIWFSDDFVKMQKVGKVRYAADFDVPNGHDEKFCNPSVKLENGKWILTFSRWEEKELPELTDKVMGIDLGIRKLATVAFGDEIIEIPNVNEEERVRRIEKRLHRLQRDVARKYRTNGHKNVNGARYKKSNNIKKKEAEIRKLYTRLANIRTDYVHKVTCDLVRMRPRRIVMEDLPVMNMVKNRHLSKSILDAHWGEFITQMAYKSLWAGAEFEQAYRFFKSSKTCSDCGAVNSKFQQGVYTFTCPVCGMSKDRDVNAAINLMNYVSAT